MYSLVAWEAYKEDRFERARGWLSEGIDWWIGEDCGDCMASSTRNEKEVTGERGEGSREECWEAIFCDINALYARVFVGGFVFTEIALSARASPMM